MANTQLSVAQLFGSNSTLSPRTSSRSRVGFQEFSFPGIDGVFGSALGEHGTEIIWSGTMQSAAVSTRSAAGTALNVLVEVPMGHRRNGTIIDLFAGESTNLEALYSKALYTNIIIREFNELGRRGFLYPTGSTFVAYCEFAVTFLKQF